MSSTRQKILIGLALLMSMSSFACLDLGINAAKNILFNGEKMAWLEGRVELKDSSSGLCNVQIFSNYEGHLAVTITNSDSSQNMYIDNNDSSSELSFRNNFIVLSNSRFKANIYLSDNMVKKIVLRQSGFISFQNYKCEF